MTGSEAIYLKKKILFSKKFRTSLWKYAITAIKEPICKLTSMESPWFSNFIYSDAKIKCEDELTGKNSVIPWIRDKKNISITFNK